MHGVDRALLGSATFEEDARWNELQGTGQQNQLGNDVREYVRAHSGCLVDNLQAASRHTRTQPGLIWGMNLLFKHIPGHLGTQLVPCHTSSSYSSNKCLVCFFLQDLSPKRAKQNIKL